MKKNFLFLKISISIIISLVIIYYIFITSIGYVTKAFITNNSFAYTNPQRLLQLNDKSIIEKNFYIKHNDLSSLNLFIINTNNNTSESVNSKVKVEILQNSSKVCSSIIPVIYIQSELLNYFPCKVTKSGKYTLYIQGINFTKQDSLYLGVIKGDKYIKYENTNILGEILTGETFQKTIFSIKNISNSFFLLKTEISQYKPNFMKNYFIYIILFMYFVVISILIFFIIGYLLYNSKSNKIFLVKVILLILLLLMIYLYLKTNIYNNALFV